MTLLVVMLVSVLLAIVAVFVVGPDLPARQYAPGGRSKRLAELLATKEDAEDRDAAASPGVPCGSCGARIARRSAYVFLAVVGTVIALFLYGYADAAADDGEGSLNPVRAGLKTLNMNLVSRFGYMCYLKYNTDWYKKEDEAGHPRRRGRSRDYRH